MRSAIIVGHGRSGTNWLLEIFDRSPNTLCSNERIRISNSALSEMPDPTVDYGQYRGLEDQWESVLMKTRSRFGERDPVGTNKTYIRRGIRGWILNLIKSKKKIRYSLCLLNSTLANEEWEIPLSAINKSELLNSVLLLKENQAPALANWIMNNCPGTVVIHIVRHPCGMLNSWKSRYYDSHDSDMVRTASRNRLSMVLNMAHWLHPITRDSIASCLSSPNPSASELELWYWRYSNEAIMECGTGKANYAQVVYEDLVKNPVSISKSLFKKVELDFPDQLSSYLQSGIKKSTEISHGWRKELSENEVQLAKHILSGSTLKNLWR